MTPASAGLASLAVTPRTSNTPIEFPILDSLTAVVTWPVDVWSSGARSFEAVLDFGGRAVESVTFDPNGRFPDRNPVDNVWPRPPIR